MPETGPPETGPPETGPPETAAAERQLARVARGGSANLVAAAVSAVFGLGLVVLVTRVFDPTTAGQFFTATSALIILLGVATLGTDTGLARFVLRFAAHDRRGEIMTCLRVARRPVIVVSVATSVVVLVTAEWLATIMGLPVEEGTATLRILALALPAAALNDVQLSATRAFGQMRSTIVVDKLLIPTVQPAMALLVALTGGGLIALGIGWAAPYLVAALASSMLLHRLLTRHGVDRGHPPRGATRVVRREFWLFTWPRSIARVLQIVLQRADIILVAALLGPRDAAVYTAATRFVALGQFSANAIQQALQPRLSQMLARDQKEAARQVFRTVTTWNMAVAWPLYAVVAGAGLSYLSIFGDEYRTSPAHLVVVIMAASMMLAVAAGPLDTMLLMAGRSTASLGNAGVAVVLDVGLCLALIPRWGIAGAGAAWAVSVLARNLLALVQVHRSLSMSPLSRGAVQVAVANLLCIFAPLLIASRAGADLRLIIAVGLVGLAAYVGYVLRSGLVPSPAMLRRAREDGALVSQAAATDETPVPVSTSKGAK